MKVGTTICSATQTVVPWSVLPARVTYMKEGAAKFEGGTGVCAARSSVATALRETGAPTATCYWCQGQTAAGSYWGVAGAL